MNVDFRPVLLTFSESSFLIGQRDRVETVLVFKECTSYLETSTTSFKSVGIR
jgi:hypothetical protein